MGTLSIVEWVIDASAKLTPAKYVESRHDDGISRYLFDKQEVFL